MIQTQKMVIGSEEWCQLNELKIPAIKVRVDSGAKTSAIHASNIQAFKRDNQSWIRFQVLPIEHKGRIAITCEAPVIDQRRIRSSSGSSEKRFVISTTITMGDQSWPIELTLANRDSMGYRMLLGREAMKGRLIVDPAMSFQCGKLSEDDIYEQYSPYFKKTKGLQIAILASNPDLYSNQRLIEAGEQRGHNMRFLNIRHCYMKVDDKTPEVHYRGGIVLDDLDAVITRIRPSLTFYGCALTRQFESMGIYTINSSAAITQSRDKLFSLQLMLKNGVPIPTTGFAHSPTDTNDLIEMVGGAPLIVKLLEGTQGQGVVLAETRKAAESVINAFKALKVNLLVQSFIKEANGKDLRCFVIDGKVIASIERTAAKGEFRANLHQGGTAKVVKITREERQLAIRAAKSLDLQVAGVDIIRSNKGPLLLEVNSSPGLEGIETASDKDIAGHIIGSIEKNLNWQANFNNTIDEIAKDDDSAP